MVETDGTVDILGVELLDARPLLERLRKLFLDVSCGDDGATVREPLVGDCGTGATSETFCKVGGDDGREEGERARKLVRFESGGFAGAPSDGVVVSVPFMMPAISYQCYRRHLQRFF